MTYIHILTQENSIITVKSRILRVVLYEYETWSVTLREEHRLRVFENWVLRREVK
jgi:hypothetical protein